MHRSVYSNRSRRHEGSPLCSVLVFSSSPVSEAWWLHHGIFSTRDFYIGLPSGHLVMFLKMLRKLVLGSVIPWWTGGFVVSFVTVEGCYPLGYFRVATGVTGFIINNASSVTRKLEGNGSMGSE